MSSGNLMRLRPFKDYLKSKFITVCDQWLTNQLNANINSNNESIYELWLNSDLNQINSNNSSVLPIDCNKIKINEQNQRPDKITLYGKYAVQINSIEDMSRPKVLSEFDALEDELNSSGDSESEAENRTNLFKRTKSKPKKEVTKRGTRALSMVLTDGRTQCKAIEYQSIDSLSVNTPVGTKLLITGPFDIYSAVIFLTERHITVLGGSIPLERENTSSDRPFRLLFPQTN